MKTLITILLLTFSINATAHQDIISYEFGVRTDISNITNTNVSLKTVTVDSKGLLTIESAPYVFGGIEPVKEVVAQKRLSEETFANIAGMVSAIANAKIKESKADAVCMIAVPLENNFDHLSTARDYDWQTGKYNSPLRVVQGPQGCWVIHSIFLEDPQANNTAKRLKAILRVLGQELI